ncbi:hypothetical protein PIB30_088587 [Stylosanthes scabra]|uniref:Uncharacterized protein n=1 Tax=Stylosanthes scabra TaxID=79078 RepID=A0ABU6TVY6_9FABA|nr:hypothetical protein [Stylosanthes scabra]
MKRHLAKIKGDVKKCPKAPYDVERQMEALVTQAQKGTNKRKINFAEEGEDKVEDAIDEAITKEKEKRKQKVQFDPIDYESISMVDFWVMEEVVEKDLDLPSDFDIDLHQSGDGGTSTFHVTSLDYSSQDGRLSNDGEMILMRQISNMYLQILMIDDKL